MAVYQRSQHSSIPEHDWSGRKSEGGPLVLILLHINITSLGRYVHDKVSLLSSTSGEAKEHEYALRNKKKELHENSITTRVMFNCDKAMIQ